MTARSPVTPSAPNEVHCPSLVKAFGAGKPGTVSLHVKLYQKGALATSWASAWSLHMP